MFSFWLPVCIIKTKVMNYFAGIDVSKATFDVTILNAPQAKCYNKFTNNIKGYKAMLKWLVTEHVIIAETLFCMENTGLYSRPLMIYLTGIECKVWIVMPIQIKRSIGLQRGKNDRVDSARIAAYALKNHNDANIVAPSEKSLELKDWLALRNRLIGKRQQMLQPINEFADMGLTAQAKEMKKALLPTLTGIDKSIKQAEEVISKLVKREPDIKRAYELMISVPGVGPITAWYLIAYSNCMRNFSDAKQLACYCGVAPFEHLSGTSVKGRTRVSPMANKQLKSLLHLGALTIVKNKKGEMFDYYKRKTGEGKNKMSVINAIRNKILQRIVSVINNQKPYHSKIAA